MKEVVAQMRFLQHRRVALKVLVQHTHRTVVGVTSALGIEAQCEQLRIVCHRRVRMLVIDRISCLSTAPCAARSLSMDFRWSDFGLVHRPPVSYPLAMQSLLASHRPGVSQPTTPRSGLVQRPFAADGPLHGRTTGRSARNAKHRADAALDLLAGLCGSFPGSPLPRLAKVTDKSVAFDGADRSRVSSGLKLDLKGFRRRTQRRGQEPADLRLCPASTSFHSISDTFRTSY